MKDFKFMLATSPRGVLKKDVSTPAILDMHRRIEIVLVSDGELTMQINRDVYTIKQGYAVFLDSYEGHSFSTDNASTCAIIEFMPEFCAEIYAPFYQWLSTHTITERLIRVPREILDCVMFLLPHDYEHMEFYDELPSRFFAILAPIFHTIMTGSESVEENNRTKSNLIRAEEFIIQNYDKELTREIVAAKVGVLPQSLSRMFSKKMNITFTEYVQYIRINQSLRKLESGETIACAALSSGFDSIRTYNRSFKRLLGKTPSEYLKLL